MERVKTFIIITGAFLLLFTYRNMSDNTGKPDRSGSDQTNSQSVQTQTKSTKHKPKLLRHKQKLNRRRKNLPPNQNPPPRVQNLQRPIVKVSEL